MNIKFDIIKKINKQKKIDPYLIIVLILVCVYIFLFYSISFMKYFSFEYGNELCVIGRHASMMSKGRIFYGFLEYEREFGACHFYMILLLFLPIYYLGYPIGMVLLFLQTLFLAMGAIPVYLLAKKKLDSKFAGIIFAICYLLYPVIQNININEFHSIPFAIPLLLFSFYFIEVNDFKKSILFIILSLLCKETVTFVIILLGFYTLIKNKNRKLGLIIIVLGLVWTFFGIFLIFPHTYGRNYFDAWSIRWNNLGNTGTEVFINFIKNPIYILSIDLSEKIKYIFGLFSPLGFMSFLDPTTLLIVAHEFVLHFSSSEIMYSLSSHQASSIIPFVFISAINAVGFLCSEFKGRYTLYVILFFIIIMSLVSTKRFSNYSIMDYDEILCDIEKFEITEHDKILFSMIEKIPKNSSLLVTQRVCPQTIHVDELYLFNAYMEDRKGVYKDTNIEYILYDNVLDPDWVNSEVINDFFEDISNDYKVVESIDGVVLYKHI